ncbi:Ger(x)C family spore germination protein [Brevibacillus brevis]|uniref:Ger(X)C family spore germination protein n=1 Tax=Brevibacillus brevis TaxID=1393 RepID=A0ABY9SZM8_BREBE|nr:Ger(x)C family spore germination protein [Brevibacillus brevis]WNC12192.1 Ger(x)C family spore germination protein [Brevibacillus brevis]
MKLQTVVIVVACSLLLGGCWDRIEVNDIAIVTAAGIDKAENKEIELSVQIFIPRSFSVGSMQGGGVKTVTLVRRARGVDIADAMSKLQMNLPRRIFWGHCKVYIYGEELAKAGVSELVDYLARHPQPRNRAFMYVSKGKAADVLNLKTDLERYSGEAVRELSGLKIGMEITLVDLINMFMGKSKAAVLPVIAVLPPSDPKKPESTDPYLFGSAVLKDGKMVGLLTQRVTRGVMWLRNEAASTTVTVKAKNVKGFVSLNPFRERTKLVPSIQDGKWKMLVVVETEGDLIQNGTHLNLVNPKWMKQIQMALQDDIETRLKLTLQQVQHGLKADIFGFATQFHRKYPKEFARVKDRWEEVFPKVEVSLKVSASIRRPGLATVPGGLTESEVKP